jgi:hypothetical protein
MNSLIILSELFGTSLLVLGAVCNYGENREHGVRSEGF